MKKDYLQIKINKPANIAAVIKPDYYLPNPMLNYQKSTLYLPDSSDLINSTSNIKPLIKNSLTATLAALLHKPIIDIEGYTHAAKTNYNLYTIFNRFAFNLNLQIIPIVNSWSNADEDLDNWIDAMDVLKRGEPDGLLVVPNTKSNVPDSAIIDSRRYAKHILSDLNNYIDNNSITIFFYNLENSHITAKYEHIMPRYSFRRLTNEELTLYLVKTLNIAAKSSDWQNAHIDYQPVFKAD